MLEPTLASVVYCLLTAGLFAGLWLYYDRRDQRRFDAERRKSTFHCIRCDALYAGGRGVDACPCPRCGHENVRLRF